MVVNNHNTKLYRLYNHLVIKTSYLDIFKSFHFLHKLYHVQGEL